MSSVLTTVLGASGYIGGQLSTALRALGCTVWAPSREELIADDYRALSERELGDVYYCIGMTANYSEKPLHTLEAHTELAARLAVLGRYNRLLYLSSTRLYDGQENGRTNSVLALNPSEPRHLFDLSKALGEHFCLMHSCGRGMVARLSCVYGPESNAGGFLPALLRRLPRETSFRLSAHSEAQRDYVHVGDVTKSLITIMANGAVGSIYNIASGANVRNATLIEHINRFGWRISLEADTRENTQPPVIDIGSLQALGYYPRGVLEYLDEYIASIKTPHE